MLEEGLFLAPRKVESKIALTVKDYRMKASITSAVISQSEQCPGPVHCVVMQGASVQGYDRRYSTSITISISTGKLNGISPPKVERACAPILSPKTWIMRSENPLMTFG